MKHIYIVSLAVLVVIGLHGAVAGQDKYITEGDSWKYFKGTEEPPAEWKDPGFDDSGWLEGATPIGYSADLTYKTVLSDMAGATGYLSVYIRKTFTVPSAAAVKALTLRMKYDDSFVAYLNGKEVTRLPTTFGTAGTPPPYNTAGVDHETNPAFQDITLDCATVKAELKDGENVLAIQGHNTATTSSDFSLSAELVSVGEFCPTEFTGTINATNTAITLKWKRPTGVTYQAIALTRNGDEITGVTNPAALSYVDRTPVVGENRYVLTATLCETECPVETTVIFAGAGPQFRRGDADGNAAVNLTDPVFTLNYLFQGGTAPGCLDAADADDNGAVSLTDPIYLLNFLFQGGPAPLPPANVTCGTDPSEDGLAACTYTSC